MVRAVRGLIVVFIACLKFSSNNLIFIQQQLCNMWGSGQLEVHLQSYRVALIQSLSAESTTQSYCFCEETSIMWTSGGQADHAFNN